MVMQFLRWYNGYLAIQLKGTAPERFLNLCRNQKISLWDVGVCQDVYTCKITVADFWRIKRIAKKTRTLPVITEKIGFPFWCVRVKKRKGMICGLISGMLLVYMLSLRVWDISFSGQSVYTEERLLKYLDSIHVYAGMEKRKVDCQKIEEQIRLKYPDIGWVSAELKGSKLSIAMVETNMPVPATTRKKAGHLVASHDGIVETMVTRKGKPMVKVGDKVKKGDVLISGVLELKDDGGNIIKKEAVCADGDINIRTEYVYQDSCEERYEKKYYTGVEKKALEIGFLNKKILFTNPFRGFNKERKYDIMANECNIAVSKSFSMPFSYRTICYREYTKKDTVYTEKEGKRILKNRYRQYLKRLKEQNVCVKEEKVVFKKKGHTFFATGTLVVTEPVHEYQEVKETEWRMNQPDELSGDND